MNDHPTDKDGAKVVIVLQPVTDTINTALRAAGYQPDTITADYITYHHNLDPGCAPCAGSGPVGDSGMGPADGPARPTHSPPPWEDQ